MEKNKENLSEKFYNYLVQFILDDVHNVSCGKGWVASWWIREDIGYNTQKINYYLDKLIKEGRVVKRVTRHCSMYRPTEIPGYKFEDDKFYKITEQ